MATNTAASAMSPPQPHPTPSSARAPASACPLLRLPAELLQQIYFYLPLGTPSYPRLLTRYTWMQAAPSHATPALQTPPLARTCRRLRADVLALYLGHLRVELCDSNELDGVFLERCLRALGSAVLHVKRLTVDHMADICIDEDRRDAVRKRAQTIFEVKGPPAGEASQAARTVEVTCTFERTTLLGDERLPADSDLCECPLATLLSDLSSTTTTVSPPPNTQPSEPFGISNTHAKIFPCPLTKSILTFLTYLDTTSSPPELETRPRYQQQNLSSAPHGWCLKPAKPLILSSSSPPDNPATKWWPWPLCPNCNRKKYLLQGPITGPYLRNLALNYSSSPSSWSGTGRGELAYVNYAGFKWISCPYIPAKQSAENTDAALNKYSTMFKCRWGPARPRLVKAYGAKSRALLRQERDFLFS